MGFEDKIPPEDLDWSNVHVLICSETRLRDSVWGRKRIPAVYATAEIRVYDKDGGDYIYWTVDASDRSAKPEEVEGAAFEAAERVAIGYRDRVRSRRERTEILDLS